MPHLRRRLLLDFYLGGILHALLKPPVMLLGWLLRRDHDLKKCQEVTYLKLLGGGSLIIAYPSLLAMKAAGKKLRLVTMSGAAPFGELLGVFDEIIVVRENNLLLTGLDSLSAIARLFRIGAIVDLEIHSRLSTVFSVLTMARNRIDAYTESSFWRSGISTHLIYYNKASPVYVFYDQAAELFGATIPPFETCVATFRERIAELSKQFVFPAGGLAIAPACSDLSRERRLTTEQWLTVLDRHFAEDTSAEVHLLGGPTDRPYLDALLARLREQFPSKTFHNHAGEFTLAQSIAFLATCKRLIAIDSALLHLARLLGVPTVSYWGPTAPSTLLRPRAVSLDVVHYHRITCSPCVHIANDPPCHGNNICMQFAVDPECGLPENPAWLAYDPNAGRN